MVSQAAWNDSTASGGVAAASFCAMARKKTIATIKAGGLMLIRTDSNLRRAEMRARWLGRRSNEIDDGFDKSADAIRLWNENVRLRVVGGNLRFVDGAAEKNGAEFWMISFATFN